MTIPLPVVIATIISCVGNTFTFLTYLLFPTLRTPSQVFALWLAIGSYGFSFFTFMPMIYMSDHACKYYGALSTYFGLISALTTAVIASCMRNIFFNRNTQTKEHLVRVRWKHYFVVFVLPMVLVWLPATTNSFGKNEDDIFCWIRFDSSHKQKNALGFMWVLITFYVPLGLIFIYNTAVYVSVYLHVRTWKDNQATESDRVIQVVNKIRWYPVILVVVYIVPLYHRLAYVADGLANYHSIAVAGLTILKLQGFLDAAVYSATPMVLSKWRDLLCGCWKTDATKPLVSPTGGSMSDQPRSGGESGSSAKQSDTRWTSSVFSYAVDEEGSIGEYSYDDNS